MSTTLNYANFTASIEHEGGTYVISTVYFDSGRSEVTIRDATVCAECGHSHNTVIYRGFSSASLPEELGTLLQMTIDELPTITGKAQDNE